MNTKHIMFSILLLIFTAEAMAETKIYKIGTFEIPMMVTTTDSGVFVDLFKEAARRSGEQFQIMIFPPKRVVMMFNYGSLDGFFPAMDKSAGEKAAKTDTIYVKDIVVFVRKDTSFIDDITQLKGKRVGLTLGYTYDEKITSNPDIEIDYAHSDITSMKKLSMGRIDAFVVEKKSGIAALKQSGVSNVHYNPEKPLKGERVFFAFQGNEEGKILADKFSKALSEMKADGTFEKILSIIK